MRLSDRGQSMLVGAAALAKYHVFIQHFFSVRLARHRLRMAFNLRRLLASVSWLRWK